MCQAHYLTFHFSCVYDIIEGRVTWFTSIEKEDYTSVSINSLTLYLGNGVGYWQNSMCTFDHGNGAYNVQCNLFTYKYEGIMIPRYERPCRVFGLTAQLE